MDRIDRTGDNPHSYLIRATEKTKNNKNDQKNNKRKEPKNKQNEKSQEGKGFKI